MLSSKIDSSWVTHFFARIIAKMPADKPSEVTTLCCYDSSFYVLIHRRSVTYCSNSLKKKKGSCLFIYLLFKFLSETRDILEISIIFIQFVEMCLRISTKKFYEYSTLAVLWDIDSRLFCCPSTTSLCPVRTYD